VEERNWAGNHRYRAGVLHRPRTVEELQKIVAGAASVRVLGSRHSFSDIADADELVSLEALPQAITIDREAATVTVSAGVRYGDLAVRLVDAGLALGNLASLPHISVAGATATATHGSGVTNGNLATAVAALQLVRSDGELARFLRGQDEFDGVAVNLGALGAVTEITLDAQPAYEVRQRVFDHLSWPAFYDNFDAIMASGYSVSAFTRWGDGVEQVWVKRREGDGGEPGATELFDAIAAREPRHPIVGMDPVHCTRQLGTPGPWSDRLPHFRLAFTPSAGDELQSEYHLGRDQALAGIDAVRALSSALDGLVQVSEIRTIAADRLWMSPQHGRDSVAIHFTWAPRAAEVARALAALEEKLMPLGARPHWGKVFLADADEIAPRYERHGDFVALARRLDPRAAFSNRWLRERVLGDRR
jgi:xylitol oxidase